MMIDGTVFWMAATIDEINLISPIKDECRLGDHSSGYLQFRFAPVNGNPIESTLRLSVAMTQNQEVVEPNLDPTISEQAFMGYCLVGEMYDPTEQIRHTTHTHNLSVLTGYTIVTVQDATGTGTPLNHDEFHWSEKKQPQTYTELWVHRHDYAITLHCPGKINLVMLIRTVVESTSAFRYGRLVHHIE